MVTFRSAVLTPILQRQRLGVDDAYMPSVLAAVRALASNPRKPTPKTEPASIHAATGFYLSDDPIHPSHNVSYRRNLLYLPIARWHLGRVLGQPKDPGPESEISYYNSFFEHHDNIMEVLRVEGHPGRNANGVPLLTRAEITAIILEGIEDFFQMEFDEQVTHTLPQSEPSLQLVVACGGGRDPTNH
jgi:hypothetical protein